MGRLAVLATASRCVRVGRHLALVDGGLPGGLRITGQAMSDVQARVTLTVYWSYLYYAGLKDTVPTVERCAGVLPVILQLMAID